MRPAGQTKTSRQLLTSPGVVQHIDDAVLALTSNSLALSDSSKRMTTRKSALS